MIPPLALLVCGNHAPANAAEPTIRPSGLILDQPTTVYRRCAKTVASMLG